MAKKSSSLKNILKVALGTLGSRVLGLLRDILTTAFLGVNAVSSAFLCGFSIPNLFRRLMGEGAMSTAFVPIFSQTYKNEGKEKSFEFLNKIVSRASVILIILVLIGVGISLAIRFVPNIENRYFLGASFSAMMMPYMILICLAALFCAALNVLGRFTLPALTAVWLNIALISFTLIGGLLFKLSSYGIALCMCAGVLVGGLLQFLIPFFELRSLGWNFKFDFAKSKEVAEFTNLFLPALVGAMVIQANMFVSQLIAISIDNTATSAIYVSSRLVELPLGLFTFSIITVYFPKLSSLAKDEDSTLYAREFSKGLTSLMFITIPAAVGLICLNDEILQMIFEWGKFDKSDVSLCAPILALSAIGIPFYSLATYASRSFHSLKDTKTPVKISLAAFVINLSVALILIRPYGAKGLVLANVISGIFQAFSLNFLFFKRKATEKFFKEILKIAIASVVMAVTLLFAKNALALIFEGKELSILACAILIPASVAIYALTLFIAKFKGFNDLKIILKRNK